MFIDVIPIAEPACIAAVMATVAAAPATIDSHQNSVVPPFLDFLVSDPVDGASGAPIQRSG